MATKDNQRQQDDGREFGLPQAEFQPLDNDSNYSWLKLMAIILGIGLLIGGSVALWFFYRSPHHSAEKEQKDYEQNPEEDFLVLEEDHAANNSSMDSLMEKLDSKLPDTDHNKSEASNTANKFDTQEASTPASTKAADNQHLKASPTPEKGIFTRINTPQGCYHVVVGSFIDDDMALDYVKELTKKGFHVMLIDPQKGKDYFRVTIVQTKTLAEANAKIEALKPLYGPDIWVLKY